MLNYLSTYNTPIDENVTGSNSWNIDPWLYSCRIRVWGAGGGGEFISDSGSTSYTRIPVYRYVNPTTGDHFSTTSQGTSPPFGYQSEGILCYVFSQQAPGTVGIFDDDDGDRSSAGRPYSGIMGYAYLTSQANTIPIYALTNGYDTMWSTSTSEGSYSLFRTEFYAPTIDLTITSTSTTSIPGDNGGDSSIFGVTAEGGDGGGRLSTGSPSKNNGGAGGGTLFSGSPDWNSLGVLFTTSNGGNGTISAGGLPGFSDGVRGRGGDGSNGLRTYTSTSTHFFDNSTDTHTFFNVSSDISVIYKNPTAPDGIFGTTPSTGKYYEVTFVDAYKNNNWTYSIYSICQRAAAGGDGAAPYGLNGVNNKDSTGIDIWFQNGDGANTYIRCFTLETTGIKIGAEGRGGGAGGFIEFELTRQNLIDAGYNMNPYNLDGTQRSAGDLLNYVIGAGGYSSVDNGRDGRVEIIWYEIPQVYLVASSYAVVAGTSVNLSWQTFGDANSLSFISGEVTNGNLTSNETVTPLDTTIYTAQATGIAGTSFNTEATVTIIVYQVPIINSLDVPVSVNYGDSLIISYDVEYVNIDVRVEISYNYNDGNGFQLVDTIDISGNLSDSAQIGVGNTNAQDIQSFNIAYNDQGPRSVQLVFYFEGDGGIIQESRIVPINIDETPDNIVIPETDDVIKEEEPVYSPNNSPNDIILSDLLEIQGVDIPVEIKSNYPIKVIVNNNSSILRNVREL